MNGRRGNIQARYRGNPVYECDDPERMQFIRDNALSLLRERDELIERLREQVKMLEASRLGMKRALQEYREREQ